jgi:large-conductance mechanosensitive channel
MVNTLSTVIINKQTLDIFKEFETTSSNYIIDLTPIIIISISFIIVLILLFWLIKRKNRVNDTFYKE